MVQLPVTSVVTGVCSKVYMLNVVSNSNRRKSKVTRVVRVSNRGVVTLQGNKGDLRMSRGIREGIIILRGMLQGLPSINTDCVANTCP